MGKREGFCRSEREKEKAAIPDMVEANYQSR